MSRPAAEEGVTSPLRAEHDPPPPRGIRSYVLRRSHFSAAQRDAHERLMPVYGVPFSRTPLDFAALFGRSAPTILEIGFGMGSTTAEIAGSHPDRDYLGVEVHTPGVGALLKLLEVHHLSNVRVIEHDIQEVVEFQIPDKSLTGVHIFFPDPWPKARHHKRRLIQRQFVTNLVSKLGRGGYLHLATDWPDYAVQMTEIVDATAGLAIAGPHDAGGGPESQPPSRPLTKFEQRGLRLGHPISDIVRFRTAT